MKIFALYPLALKDFLRFEFFKYALFSSLTSLASMLVLAFFAFSALQSYLTFSLIKAHFLFSWLYSFSWPLINTSILLLLSLFVIFGSVFISLLILSFFVPKIAQAINAKYYHFPHQSRVSDALVWWQRLKLFVKFSLLFILATPLLLAPLVNVCVYFLLFYYLFHRMFALDILSATLDAQTFQNLKFTPLEFKLHTLIFYLLSGFLVLGFIFQLLFIIILIHLSYQKILRLPLRAH
ncbi:EI24 domain-containing protein [Campylobacter sp.]|uniref:EI24 domain-containing protein n=1 Tax=Campylobacter sp. TaxID=205 RepID=UPI0026DAB18A|nr:EI24 domain-containing protein [Campylobacter sp.]MDO4674288.1 EI24 domain-containing protein [Campylobacter sp.]